MRAAVRRAHSRAGGDFPLLGKYAWGTICNRLYFVFLCKCDYEKKGVICAVCFNKENVDMRYLGLGMVLLAAGLLSGCGSVIIGESQPATSEKAESPAVKQDESVNCDAYMQQIADECFKVTAFEEDGTTPLHMQDEAGNDLGEVDQEWAAGYCECYAQLAFQTFGCTTVIEHNNLDDAAYEATYEPIRLACSAEENVEGAAEAAGAAADQAAADAAAAADQTAAAVEKAVEGN